MTARILAHRHRLVTDENSKWWTLGAMCFALFMIMLDNTVVNVALPSIQRDLHASLSALEWTVNAYTLTFAVLMVTGGRLGDIFGRRRMFIFGVAVFGISSAAIGFAPTDTTLVLFRAVQGVGAAFMMPATLSIITQAFPAEQRGTAIGTWAGVSALALAIGPVLGGFLTEYVSWRAIFWINPPIAIGAVAVTLFAARESRDETVDKTVDFPGIAAITIGLTALVLALVEGNEWGWGSTRVISLLVIAAVGLTAFVLIEKRVKAPMVNFDFFRSRTFLGANLVGFLVSFAMLAQFFFLALYMQNILGYSPLQAGIRFLPSTLVLVVMGPLAGRLTDRVGPRPLMAAGLLIVSAALFAQSGITVHTTLPAAAARVRADGNRNRTGDVADEHRRDELRRPDQVRRRLGCAVDEPDGRRHLRRRRDGRADRDARALEDRRPPAPCSVRHAGDAGQLARRRRHPARLGAGRRCRPRGVRVGARHRAWDQRRGHVLRSNRRLGADRADGRQARCRASRGRAAGRARSGSRARTDGRVGRLGRRIAPRPARVRSADKQSETERLIVAVDLTQVAHVETEPGELPATMAAWVIRQEREGEPVDAFQIEEMEVPDPGAFEVVVRVMAAGVNFNNVWAALGEPVSVFRYHPNEDHHIGGSDASGIVWKVGEGVTRWKPGDEVVIHCNQASYEDPEVHGLDPLAAPSQQIWGYETSWGSFAQFCKVQAQQLLHKPKHLAWEEAAAYGLTYFTAYRMLIDRCTLQAGHRVLIWGAAGGLGVFATQLCALTGADAVGVVSSPEKGRLVEQLGAVGYIDRSEYSGMMRKGGESVEEEKARFKESRRFSKAVEEILGGSPDIVFEHVGKATFPTSVLAVKPFGKVVICGATSGYQLDFDVRYLWMRQKEILGSHFANAWQATLANELIEESKIRPVLWQTMGFEKVAEAHQLLRDNKHLGKIAILVGATEEGQGKTADGPGAIRAEVGA